MPGTGRLGAAERDGPSEAEIRESADATAGLRLVQARLALCTPAEQAAFWAAVGRCFGAPEPVEA